MHLTQQHKISKNHPAYKEIDAFCFLTKNLYNSALYCQRQRYRNKEKYLTYKQLQKLFTSQPDYQALPRKVAQQVLICLDRSYKSFFAALKSYKRNPELFKAKPKPPQYLNKISGRFLAIFTNQAISKKAWKHNQVLLSGIKQVITTTKDIPFNQVSEIRLVRGVFCYTLEIVYKIEPVINPNLNTDRIAAIDLGVSNLATITFNFKQQPIIIPGGPAKNINQFFNKKKAELQSNLPTDKYSSNKIQQLTSKKNNKLKDYFHKASRYLINQLASEVSFQCGILVIGYNPEWKQEINIGKRNNQNFVQLPFRKFIEMLKYKAELLGIKVIITEENYTSKCSFLDNEEICRHDKYLGRRVKRGLFRTANKQKINADVNGSYNIMRKAIPGSIKGTEAILVLPRRVKTSENKLWI